MIKLVFQYFRYLLIICGLSTILNIPASRAMNQGYAQVKAHSKALQDRALADMTLSAHLAKSPQLMNVQYLECYLGPNDQSTGGPSSLSNRMGMSAAVRTLWSDAFGRNSAYKLETSQQSQNEYVAEFDALIPDKAHGRMSQMDKITGLSAKHSFDEQGQPVDVYDTRPDTKMFVYQAPGLADISKIRVLYEGPPPGIPSQADMQEATQHRRDTAAKQQKLGNYQQAAVLWQAHLRSHPDDIDAHLQLAETYKHECHLNDAISEYRIALDRSGDNDDLRKRSVAGLHSLKIDVSAQAANAGSSAAAGSSVGARFGRGELYVSPHPVSSPLLTAPPAGAPTTAAPPIIKNETPANPSDVGF